MPRPDLTLVLRDGGLVSILPSPESGFQAARRYPAPTVRWAFLEPAVRLSGADLDANELSILDIAPTVLYSLGVPLPGGIAGPRAGGDLTRKQSWKNILCGRWPARAPGTQASNHAPVSASEDEETVLDRLRELGYIE